MSQVLTQGIGHQPEQALIRSPSTEGNTKPPEVSSSQSLPFEEPQSNKEEDAADIRTADHSASKDHTKRKGEREDEFIADTPLKAEANSPQTEGIIDVTPVQATVDKGKGEGPILVIESRIFQDEQTKRTEQAKPLLQPVIIPEQNQAHFEPASLIPEKTPDVTDDPTIQIAKPIPLDYVQPPFRRRLSHSLSLGQCYWAAEVPHVIQQDNNEGVQSPDVKSQFEDTPKNAPGEEQQRKGFSKHKRQIKLFTINPTTDSNESVCDALEDEVRLEEVLRLAEESKAKLSKSLEITDELRRMDDDDTDKSFAGKILTSVVWAGIIGGATAYLTKNKRTSMITSLAALAVSFVLQ